MRGVHVNLVLGERGAYTRRLFNGESAYVAIDVAHAESVAGGCGGQEGAPVDAGLVQ